MTFYNSRLMKSRTIGRVWRSAHKLSPSRQQAKPSFGKICLHLQQWVQHDEDAPVSRRLSLRTSATLLSGAVSVYKSELEELLADLQNTADSMRGAKVKRRQRGQSLDDQAEESESSGSTTSAYTSVGDSSSSLCRPSKDVTFDDPNLEDEELDQEEAEEMEIASEDHDSAGSGCPSENRDHKMSETAKSYRQRSSTIKGKDASTQTSLEDLTSEEVDEDRERGRAVPQPFVCALVYDHNKTAEPTGIILSAVNPKVLNLWNS